MWSRDTEHPFCWSLLSVLEMLVSVPDLKLLALPTPKMGGGGARILENDLVTPRLFHFFEVGFLLSSLTVNCHSEAVYLI